MSSAVREWASPPGVGFDDLLAGHHTYRVPLNVQHHNPFEVVFEKLSGDIGDRGVGRAGRDPYRHEVAH